MTNEIKAKAKAKMLAMGFSEDVTKKALARVARWSRAAYGTVDWSMLQDEMGDDGIVQNARIYAGEIQSGVQKTFNRVSFGIYNRNR